MSSNIPKARERIKKAIEVLRDPDGKRAAVVRHLNAAMGLMVRKPRETTGEPKARKAYMTKSVKAKVRRFVEQNPGVSSAAVARIFGTDLKRTRDVLGEGK